MRYPRAVNTITTDLKSRAMEEGFDLVGVTSAGVANSTAALDGWIAAGMHGEMSYMATTRQLRSDPDGLLPGCRSVVAEP